MKRSELEQRIAPAKHLLSYFNQQALASYRNEPDKYILESDSFEGRLTVTDSYYLELEKGDRTDEYLDLRFGYRTRVDGELAIVIWLPDLKKATKHQDRWIGFFLRDPVWTEDADERFLKWAARYLEGSWDIDNGPKFYLSEIMKTVNGLTKETVGEPFFTHVIDASLNFPAAENTHRYQDAHRTLYGYLIDGINKKCLTKLATHLEKPANYSNDKAIAATVKLLPQLAVPSKFAKAVALVIEQRRKAAHAVRPPAERFEAFVSFTDNLELCVEAVKELLAVLESALGIDGNRARRRNEAKEFLPILDGQVHNFASVINATQMVGKTIERVEFGERQKHKRLHGSEGLIIYFTDGSILGIETGSNVSNITSEREDLGPEEFHTDFVLHWVPPIASPTKE